MSLFSVTFFILSICVVSNVCELLCFQCNTMQEGAACENISNSDKMSLLSKPCEGKNASFVEGYEKPLCRKIVQRIKTRNNLRVVKRSCGYELHQRKEEDLCYTFKTEDHEEVVCQCFGNYCNGADIKISNVYWSAVSSFLVIFWYFNFK